MIKIFKAIIPDNACESIIQEGLTREQLTAGIGKNNEKSKGRATKIAFIDNAFLKSYIHEIVFANYDYDIKEAEDLQFAIYNIGDFYGRHKDADETNKRILSVSVQLSDPLNYQGGELIFDSIKPIEKAQGTVIVFPSNLYHKVTPITKGIRYSLVQWFKGYESNNK
jgi:PKHD-type hydroxylase